MQITGLKQGLWGAAIGAVAITAIGFTQLGWTTASSAHQLAQDQADAAVVSALVPFCVARAHEENASATLAKLQTEQSSYSRGELVEKAGWATFDPKAGANSALASACADKLHPAVSG